jgi:hypothetical protein
LKLTGTSGDHFKLSDIADLEELDQRSDQTQELVTVAKGATLQFALTSTGQLLPTIANCIVKTILVHVTCSVSS